MTMTAMVSDREVALLGVTAIAATLDVVTWVAEVRRAEGLKLVPNAQIKVNRILRSVLLGEGQTSDLEQLRFAAT